MILGYLLLALALVATVGANVLFTLSRRPGRATLLKAAKGAVVTAAAGVVGASAYLAYLIATHQFQVAYVAEYSSLRSNKWYLFAAFWGGQEGSLLLWAFWNALLGVVLAYRSGEQRTSRVWPIYGIAQVFLLGLLLLKCPFYVPADKAVPADGRGLNPLLENMWMVIHPPVLFLGFSSLLAPFAWAVYGLAHRDWDGWARSAFSWSLFSFATLGLGLALGGYWAYETLGWGGFWAWDPVENSSLVPWMFITALLHGIAVQNKNGGYRVTNFVMGVLPFATMFYGTFLTRTGVLADFSVHSFSSLGKDGFIFLLTGVLLSLLVPLGLLVWRFKQIPKPPAYERVWTREFGYFLASALLGLIGLITAVGMSAPLFTKLWIEKGAAPEPTFYNQATYPLAILLTVGMAVTPFLAWKASDVDSVRRRLLLPYCVAILLTIVMAGAAMYLGLRKPWQLLLFATSIFAVLANAVLILPRLKHRSSRRTLGGFVAHVGAGLTLAGVACMVAFQQSERQVMLVRDRPLDLMGYRLTYLGQTSHPFDRDNNALRIRVEKNGRVWEARPRFYVAPWAGKDTEFGNPPAVLPSLYSVQRPADIQKLLPWNNPFPWGDLYIAASTGPQTAWTGEDGQPKHSNSGFFLKPQEPRQFGDYTFMLLSLDLDEKAKEAIQKGSPAAMNALPTVTFKAQVGVDWRGEKQEIVTAEFVLDQRAGGKFSNPVKIPGPDSRETLLVLLPPTDEELNSSKAFEALPFQTMNAEDPTEHVYIEISTKPLIGLVWAGPILYTLGGLVAYRRRAYEMGILGTKESPLPDNGDDAAEPEAAAGAAAKSAAKPSA
jgi:Cytochrome c biogenesis factor